MASPRAGAQTTQLGRVEANTLSILAILKANATQDQANQAQLLAALQSIDSMLSSGIAAIVSILTDIQQEVNGAAPDGTPAAVRFVVPTYRDIKTGKSLNMATSLLNDVISNIPLEFDNLAGQSVAAPGGGSITLGVVDAGGAASTVATVAMGADGMSVDVTPTPHDGSNTASFTITFDDAANVDLKATLDCSFTADQQAANVHFKTDAITTRPIPAAAPAPTP